MDYIVNKLCTFLSDYFHEREWTWSLAGRGSIEPSPEDMNLALDLAHKTLYNSDVGTILEVGRLVIIKQVNSLDVYVLAGEYNKENK